MISIFKDCRGTIALLTAFLMVPLLGIVGLALDSSRAYDVRGQLQSALDAAALAGGRYLFLPAATRDATIRAYFQQNLNSSRFGTVADPAALVINANTTHGILDVSISAVMPSSIIGVLGFHQIDVGAHSQVKRANTTLEVALSLDLSGSMNYSMGGGTRLDALKSAAGTMLDILYPNGTDNDVQMSIVPWNSRVFVGTGYSSWLNVLPAPADWQGVFYQRYASGDDLTDLSPSTLPFSAAPKYVAGTPLICKVSDVLPMRSNPVQLRSYVNAMTAVGGTASAPGLSWAWYTISPKWRGKWSGVGSTLPKDYNAARNIKAIVLMTDGENNFPDDTYSPSPAVPNTPAAFTWLNDRSELICDAIKAEGVRIYTIGLSDDVLLNSAVVDWLTSCATNGNFFAAPDSTTLESAFSSIASDLAALRLTQ